VVYIGHNVAVSEHVPMEPQRFGLKKWLRTVQTLSGGMVIGLGVLNIAGGANPIIGAFFIFFGLFALGQVAFAGVVAFEEGLQVRYNIPKAKFFAWEDIEFAPASGVLMLRLTSGQMVRIPPYLGNSAELRSMINDTVGPPPPAPKRESRKSRKNRRKNND